jgi:hypothetical protein
MRTCGRVKIRVEACRTARSGRGNLLALSCAKNGSVKDRELFVQEGLTAENGAALKNASGRMRVKEVIADTTRSVLKDW